MVSNRQITLQLAETQITRLIPKGCPQGGVLSPFLWNLVLNDLLNSFSFTNNLQAFADDLSLLTLGCDVSTIWDIAQAELKRINEWCNKNGLQISEVKTQVILWTRNFRLKYPKHIKINNINIALQESAKYLGITIDKYLNWNEHIDKTVEKCIKCIFAAKKAIVKKLGLSPANIRWLYTIVVIPKLTYGAVAWGFGMSERNIKQLNRIQHLIATLITNAQKSTAQEVLDIILDLDPIDRFIEKTALLRATCIRAENHWIKDNPINRTKLTNMEKISKELQNILGYIYHLKIDKTRPALNLDNLFTCKIIDNASEFKTTTESTLDIYTDGSKDTKNNTGFGFFITETKTEQEIISKSESLKEYITVFQAEAIALIEATKYILKKGPSKENIHFYTDSQALIKTLESKKNDKPIIANCLNLLNSLAKHNSVTINWIPGHKGHEGNETADQLAKLGAQLKPPSLDKHFISINKVNDIITKHFIKSKLISWKHTSISKRATEITNILLEQTGFNTNKMAKAILKCNKNEITSLVKTISGKNCMNYNLYNIGYSYTKDCEYCSPEEEEKENFKEYEEETAAHILCDCPAFTNTRQQIYGKPTLELHNLKGINITLTIKNIIKFIDSTKILNRPNKYQKWQLSPSKNRKRKHTY